MIEKQHELCKSLNHESQKGSDSFPKKGSRIKFFSNHESLKGPNFLPMGVLAISFLNWGMGGCVGNSFLNWAIPHSNVPQVCPFRTIIILDSQSSKSISHFLTLLSWIPVQSSKNVSPLPISDYLSLRKSQMFIKYSIHYSSYMPFTQMYDCQSWPSA